MTIALLLLRIEKAVIDRGDQQQLPPKMNQLNVPWAYKETGFPLTGPPTHLKLYEHFAYSKDLIEFSVAPVEKNYCYAPWNPLPSSLPIPILLPILFARKQNE